MGLNINVWKCELIAHPGCNPTLPSFEEHIPTENAELLGRPTVLLAQLWICQIH